jgi:ParB/RepB/Spo0J family partition protein
MKKNSELIEKEAKEVKVVRIPLDKCVPMPELEREFYDDANYQRLKQNIFDRGLDATSPIKVLPTDGVYEIYVGIHRWKAAKELGTFGRIPAFIDYEIDRQQAFAEGINDNHTHSSYNPVDFARHIKEWGVNQAKKESKALKLGAGRPKIVDIERIAKRFHLTENVVKKYFLMLKPPDEVLRLVGQQKLWITHAIVLTRLVGTRYEKMILHLAGETIENGYTVQKLTSIVESILKKGSYSEDCRCTGCGKIYPFKAMTSGRFCPSCEDRVQNGSLKVDDTEEHNKARAKYLTARAWSEKYYKEIPQVVTESLEKLHNKWTGKESSQED